MNVAEFNRRYIHMKFHSILHAWLDFLTNPDFSQITSKTILKLSRCPQYNKKVRKEAPEHKETALPKVSVATFFNTRPTFASHGFARSEKNVTDMSDFSELQWVAG